MDSLDVQFHRALLRQLKGICSIYQTWIDAKIEAAVRDERAARETREKIYSSRNDTVNL